MTARRRTPSSEAARHCAANTGSRARAPGLQRARRGFIRERALLRGPIGSVSAAHDADCHALEDQPGTNSRGTTRWARAVAPSGSRPPFTRVALSRSPSRSDRSAARRVLQVREEAVGPEVEGAQPHGYWRRCARASSRSERATEGPYQSRVEATTAEQVHRRGPRIQLRGSHRILHVVHRGDVVREVHDLRPRHRLPAGAPWRIHANSGASSGYTEASYVSILARSGPPVLTHG